MNGNLISREALLDTISECYDDAAVYDSHMREVIERHCYYAADLVREAPAVDAVPVVRCKDCDNHNQCFVEETFRLCNITDGYCRVGKKRKEQVEVRVDGDSEC